MSLLKKYLGDPQSHPISIPLPFITMEEGLMLQPTTILYFGTILQNDQQIHQALV